MRYWFVDFDIDLDFVIAVISDGTQEWHVAATVLVCGDTLKLRGFHMHGAGPWFTGVARLLSMARWLKDEIGVRQLRIEGAARTTGAGPGRIPRPLVV
jgi:hypothetical protein